MTDKTNNKQMIENWMKVGEDALRKGDYQEAYELFTRVAVEDPNNWMSIFLRGKAAAYQSNFEESRIKDFTVATKDSMEILSQADLSDKEKNKFKKFIANEIYDFVNQYYQKTEKKISSLLQTEIESDNFTTYVGTYRQESLEILEIALSLLMDIQDEETFKLRLDIKKVIVWLCHFLSQTIKFNKKSVSGVKISMMVGRDVENKQVWIDRHDELLLEIRLIEPDFKDSKRNKNFAIDRLERPDPEEDLLSSHPLRLQKVQEEIDQGNRLNEVAYRRQYWEKHPVEKSLYIKFLEEEKRKQIEEEKRKQQELAEQKRKEQEIAKQKRIEIDEKINLLAEQEKDLNQKIEHLNTERDQLGLFAARKKKEIDAKVYALDKTIKNVRNEIRELEKQLRSVNLKLRD
jgi:hypothetical protein